MSLEPRIVPHGSPGYVACVDLRRRVLRLPLGMDFTAEELAGEDGQIHLGLFEGEVAWACLALVPRGAEMKMRQVAVDPVRQGSGIGRRLVAFSEEIARSRGAARMVLHARESAVPFYLRLGYAVEREPFVEIGIPHRYMAKNLGSPSSA